MIKSVRIAVVCLFALVCAHATASFAAGIELPPDSVFTPPVIPLPEINSTNVFNVKDFGATGDGATNDTAAINTAIETCHAEGGGTVQFPPGKYLVASVRLLSNMQLLLDDDAEIIGAREGYLPPEPNPYRRYQDFGHSHFRNSVLWGEDLENVAIIGGKINGGGTTTSNNVPEGRGDKVISVRVGRNLLFRDILHETGGHFVYLLNDCENVTINNVTIQRSRDAVDLMGCRNVAIYDCHFTGCSDDTIGIKSDYALGRRIDSENIWVWDCYFESGCNGLQFGSETVGDFRNMYFWNIEIARSFKAGIGITSNDGGVIENVHYKDITISGAANPIFMLVTNRMRTGEADATIGAIRNVTIQNVTVTEVVAGRHHGPANCATISGRPESAIENILLENVKIVYKGGEDRAEAALVPPLPRGYSPNNMGKRPASGFFIRHAKDLVFRNVEIEFEGENLKPPLVVWDVDGLTFEGVRVPATPGVDVLRTQRVENLSAIDSPAIEAALAHPEATAGESDPAARFDADLPPVSQAQIAAIRDAIEAARPGDTIVLPDGIWKDVELNFDARGEEGRPITLRAETPGNAIFMGNSSIRIAGQHLIVSGVRFTGPTESRQPAILFAEESSHCRLTNSAIADFKGGDNRFHYVRILGSHHRVDHNLFAGKTNMNPVLAGRDATHVRIDHNHFRDIPRVTANGKEIIQIVGIGSNDEPLNTGGCYWLVERNLFERAHGEAEEIISIKSNHNIIRNNTVRGTRGYFVMRSGGGNTFEGNFIFGDGQEGAGGLRISGENARVINNYIEGSAEGRSALQLHAGEYILTDLTGRYEPLLRQAAPLGRVAAYLQLKDAVVANNIVVHSRGPDFNYGAGYGAGWPGRQRIWLPDNLVLENNIVLGDGDADRPMLRLQLGDERSALLPTDTQPRPVRGRNNVLFGGEPGAEELPGMFGFRIIDPELSRNEDGLYMPAVDSPAVAEGFDLSAMNQYRPVTAADVGPDWTE